MGVGESTISRIFNSEDVDDKFLIEFTKATEMPIQYIQNYRYISSNNLEEYEFAIRALSVINNRTEIFLYKLFEAFLLCGNK